jgi:hypothetical protein
MKKVICLVLALLVLFLASTLPAYAYWRGGVWIEPGWGPWWDPQYPYGPYYSEPPVVIQQQPPTYVEPTPQQKEQYYWYYCKNPEGYYPYLKKCPGGWLKVIPPVPPDEEE